MFSPGDICTLSTEYSKHYGIIRISKILGTSYYEFETVVGTESCHIRSILASHFQLIVNNISSLDEFESLYPEYFI